MQSSAGIGAAEVPPLAELDAELLEQHPLTLGLDALGHDVQAHRQRHRDDRPDDLGVVRVVLEPGHERAVDLHLGHGEPAQVGQRRVAGAEVVDREGQPERRAAGAAASRRTSSSAISADSVISRTSRLGGQAVARSSSASTWSTSERVAQLAGRDVDRDPQVGRPCRPAGRASAAAWRQRLGEHPRADLDDEAGLLGDRDEVQRRDQAQARVRPAQQRLDADDLAGLRASTIGW